MDCKIIKYTLLIFLINFKVFSAEFQGQFIQGHYIIGKTSPGTKILIDKREVKVTEEGYFAFGIDKDRKFDVVITEGSKKIIKKSKKENIKFKE